MGRLWLAIQVFFQVLLRADLAARVRALMHSGAAATAAVPTEAPRAAAPPAAPAGRSDALVLLEMLQREARLLDFIQENIDGYSDEQVGGAVREVHRACRSVLQRAFGIVPAVDEAEGARITVADAVPAARIRLVGNVSAMRPVTGTLVHAGWRAQRCELPHWSGSAEAAQILAPAEVEVR